MRSSCACQAYEFKLDSSFVEFNEELLLLFENSINLLNKDDLAEIGIIVVHLIYPAADIRRTF